MKPRRLLPAGLFLLFGVVKASGAGREVWGFGAGR